jgi:hypothetical protein
MSAAMLVAHSWPGNVRELENLILKHYLLEPSPVVRITSFDAPANGAQATTFAADGNFKRAKARAVAAFEQSYIKALLERSGGNVSLAARLAGARPSCGRGHDAERSLPADVQVLCDMGEGNKMPLRRRLADSGLRASRGELNPTATVHLHLLGKPSA